MVNHKGVLFLHDNGMLHIALGSQGYHTVIWLGDCAIHLTPQTLHQEITNSSSSWATTSMGNPLQMRHVGKKFLMLM